MDDSLQLSSVDQVVPGVEPYHVLDALFTALVVYSYAIEITLRCTG